MKYTIALLITLSTISKCASLNDNEKPAPYNSPFYTTLESIERSHAMDLLSKVAEKTINYVRLEKIIDMLFGAPPTQASDELQKLYTQAQHDVNIITECHRPIIAQNAPVEKGSGFRIASASYYQISLNEEEFKKCSPSEQRFIALHESIHVAHNDVTCATLVGLSSGTLASYITNRVLTFTKRKPHTLPSFIAFAAASFYSVIQHSKLAESRADTLAAHYCACYKCLEEAAYTLPSISSKRALAQELLQKGYLSREELLTIQQRQQQQNKLCARHAQR